MGGIGSGSGAGSGRDNTSQCIRIRSDSTCLQLFSFPRFMIFQMHDHRTGCSHKVKIAPVEQFGNDRAAKFAIRDLEGDVVWERVIYLVPTVTPLGGLRWWWLCPSCGAKRQDLYIPPGSWRPSCRVCHGLTYSSCQTNRAGNRFDALMGSSLGLTGRQFKQWMENDYRHEQARLRRNQYRCHKRHNLALGRRFAM